MSALRDANAYVEEEKPWELRKATAPEDLGRESRSAPSLTVCRVFSSVFRV